MDYDIDPTKLAVPFIVDRWWKRVLFWCLWFCPPFWIIWGVGTSLKWIRRGRLLWGLVSLLLTFGLPILSVVIFVIPIAADDIYMMDYMALFTVAAGFLFYTWLFFLFSNAGYQASITVDWMQHQGLDELLNPRFAPEKLRNMMLSLVVMFAVSGFLVWAVGVPNRFSDDQITFTYGKFWQHHAIQAPNSADTEALIHISPMWSDDVTFEIKRYPARENMTAEAAEQEHRNRLYLDYPGARIINVQHTVIDEQPAIIRDITVTLPGPCPHHIIRHVFVVHQTTAYEITLTAACQIDFDNYVDDAMTIYDSILFRTST